MLADADLLRNLILRLERRQVSPRTTIIIEPEDEAEILRADKTMIIASLDRLLDLGYIEGPGEDNGAWLFRKLTAKGTRFAAAACDPKDWEMIKRHFQQKP